MWKIITRTYKIYTKEEVLKPMQGRSYKNLYEMAAQYRSQGVGFHFWRSTWPANSYYTITKMDFSDPRHGKAWGKLTWKGEESPKEEQIRSPLKKNTWRYKAPEIETDQDNKK